jgi:hypothetical protein
MDRITKDLETFEASLRNQLSLTLTSNHSTLERDHLSLHFEAILSDFCFASPDLHASDQILNALLSTLPHEIASNPHAFVQPHWPPLKSAFAASVLGVYTKINGLELASKVSAQTRLRMLLCAIEQAIAELDDAGKQQCAEVSKVISHVCTQKFLDDWDADLDINAGEGSDRQHQWIDFCENDIDFEENEIE